MTISSAPVRKNVVRDNAPVRPPHFLIADDDPIFSSLATNALKPLDGVVVEARDGAEALHLLEKSYFDLAFIDLSMPQIDGLRLIAHIRATPHIKNLPIIVVTSQNSQSVIDRAHALNIESYLTKPINWALFPHHVEFVLRASQAISATRTEKVA